MRVGFITSCKNLSYEQQCQVEKVLLRLKVTEAHHCNNSEADRLFQSHALLQEATVKIQLSKRALVSAIEVLIVVPRVPSDTTSLIGQGRKLRRKIVIINSAGDAIHES